LGKGKRFYLKGKEVKLILERVSKTLNLNPLDFLDPNSRFETMEITPNDKILLLDEKPTFIESGGDIFPTLLNEIVLSKLPSIIVDMGAVPHICNGADIMAPGVIKVDGEFNVGSIIVIVEGKFSKRIAIAKALITSQEMTGKKYGKVAKNIHYISDRFWDALKK